MNEEEKKAIELLEQYLNFGNKEGVLCKNLRTIYTIIEKQSKEIEELKKPKYIIDCETNEITMLVNEFISKDKIKAKIKDITDYYKKEVEPEMYHWGDFTVEEHYSDVIAILNELLEE